MNELIKKINEHRKYNNPKICYELIALIEHLKIDNENGLRKYENNNFTPVDSNNKMADNIIIETLINSFLNDTTHYDYLTAEDESELMDLYHDFQKAKTNDEKFILLIKIYSVAGWGIHLPYHAYSYIIRNELR